MSTAASSQEQLPIEIIHDPTSSSFIAPSIACNGDSKNVSVSGSTVPLPMYRDATDHKHETEKQPSVFVPPPHQSQSTVNASRMPSSQQRMRGELEKKSPADLIEMSIQLHELLTHALKDQNNFSRAKIKQKLLEDEIKLLRHQLSTREDLRQVQVKDSKNNASIEELQQKVNELVIENKKLIACNTTSNTVETPDKSQDLFATHVPTHFASLSRGVVSMSPIQIFPSSQQFPTHNIEASAPIIGLLPTTPTISNIIGRFPGKAPPLPSIAKEKNTTTSGNKQSTKPSSRLPSVPNIASMLMKRFTSGTMPTGSSMNDFKSSKASSMEPKLPPRIKPLTKSTPLPKPTHNRIQLYWPPITSNSPPRIKELNTNHSHTQHLNSSIVTSFKDRCPLEETDPEAIAQSHAFRAKHEASQIRLTASIFHELLNEEGKEHIETLLKDSRLDEWFTKKRINRAVKKLKTKPEGNLLHVSTKRLSVLGPAASQKYQITVHCFKKAFDTDGGWTGFKQSVLHCRLNKSQIHLLLETVPDPDTSQDNRKLQEWEDLIQKVNTFRQEFPLEPLYEDEEFIGSIPNIRQRLQCMLIMESFPELISRLNSDIDILMDSIELLLRHQNIKLLFHAILSIGNYLNEGTAMGNRKWFRIATLQRVIDFRGAGHESKSLLYFLAYHIGPLMTLEESAIIAKAAQISIIQVVQNSTQIYDILHLLGDESFSKGQTLLSRKRRNSTVQETDDLNDRFSEVGRQFIKDHKFEFLELREDLRRLIGDYQMCVSYFGDTDAFLPIDKKIEDEKNPGQQRYVPDIFNIFNQLLLAFKPVLRDIELERGKEKAEMSNKLRRPLSNTPSSINVAQNVSDQTSQLIVKDKTLESFPSYHLDMSHIPDIIQKDTSLFIKNDTHSIQDDGTSFTSNVLHTQIIPEPKETVGPDSDLLFSTQVSSSTVPLSSESIQSTPFAKPSNVRRRRASLRPSLFPVKEDVHLELQSVVSQLNGIEEFMSVYPDNTLVTEQDSSVSDIEHTDRRHLNLNQLLQHPMTPLNTITENTSSNLLLSNTTIHEQDMQLNTRRRRESLRAVADLLTDTDHFNRDTTHVYNNNNNPTQFIHRSQDIHHHIHLDNEPSTRRLSNTFVSHRPLQRMLPTSQQSRSLLSNRLNSSESLLQELKNKRQQMSNTDVFNSSTLIGKRPIGQRQSIHHHNLASLIESPQEDIASYDS